MLELKLNPSIKFLIELFGIIRIYDKIIYSPRFFQLVTLAKTIQQWNGECHPLQLKQFLYIGMKIMYSLDGE